MTPFKGHEGMNIKGNFLFNNVFALGNFLYPQLISKYFRQVFVRRPRTVFKQFIYIVQCNGRPVFLCHSYFTNQQQ